jgi:hypothetical protein
LGRVRFQKISNRLLRYLANELLEKNFCNQGFKLFPIFVDHQQGESFDKLFIVEHFNFRGQNLEVDVGRDVAFETLEI